MSPGERLPVLVALQPPAGIAAGATGEICFVVSEGSKRLKRVAISWEAAVSVADGWTDNFDWKANGSLKMETREGRLRLAAPTSSHRPIKSDVLRDAP